MEISVNKGLFSLTDVAALTLLSINRNKSTLPTFQVMEINILYSPYMVLYSCGRQHVLMKQMLTKYVQLFIISAKL